MWRICEQETEQEAATHAAPVESTLRHTHTPPSPSPEVPARSGRPPPGGGSGAAPSILGDMGGETMGVIKCGSVYMLVAVSGSHVICVEEGRVDGWIGGCTDDMRWGC